MFSSPTQPSSPLAHLGSKPHFDPQLFHPIHSSPLSGSSSPTNTAQARRKRQYKSQSSSRSVAAPPNLLGVLEDTPQKQFLRERFRARCLERAKEGRARVMRRGRASSSGDGSSSDGFDMDGDFAMDDDDEDNLDDELYRRVMMNEERRAQHAKRVSFERDFGSSIDPNMYDDMNTLEMELTGQASKLRAPSPPLDDLDDDALIQEYLAELEEPERQRAQEEAARIASGIIDLHVEDPVDLEREFIAGNEMQHPSPSKSMFSDFQMSSPTSSPSHPRFASAAPSSPPRQPSTWCCPFCSTTTARTHIACLACVGKYPLEHARLAWIDAESHPEVQHGGHVPLATTTPNESGVGIVMLCGAQECDWCFAL